jgi:hypothetical protein
MTYLTIIILCVNLFANTLEKKDFVTLIANDAKIVVEEKHEHNVIEIHHNNFDAVVVFYGEKVFSCTLSIAIDTFVKEEILKVLGDLNLKIALDDKDGEIFVNENMFVELNYCIDKVVVYIDRERNDAFDLPQKVPSLRRYRYELLEKRASPVFSN